MENDKNNKTGDDAFDRVKRLADSYKSIFNLIGIRAEGIDELIRVATDGIDISDTEDFLRQGLKIKEPVMVMIPVMKMMMITGKSYSEVVGKFLDPSVEEPL